MFTDETGYFFWLLFIVAIVGSAFISAGANIITQGITKGWNNINWGQVGWSALTGALSGTLIASGVGALGMALWGGAIGFVDSVGYQLIGGASLSEINWLSVGFSTFIGAAPGIALRKGATHISVLEKALPKSIAYDKAALSVQKVINKISAGAYRTVVGSKIALSRVTNNLFKVTNKVFEKAAWKSLGIKFLFRLLGKSAGIFSKIYLT